MPRRRSDPEYEPWWEYERTTPRPANGIKAQTQRGKFGKTWWASRWVAALERLVDSARLSRGRSYARSGQVVKLDVRPKGVDARVQGSRPTPYKVEIRFQPLSDADWDKVADALAGQAFYAARLLNGEMPEDIEDAFAAAGTSLFPARRSDLQTECSCPDWANPCKHVAAVHYLLGERFDADPFLIFLLRGRSQEQLAAMLRARRSGALPSDETAHDEPPPADEPAVPLDQLVATYWSAPADILALPTRFEPPTVDALPVKRLGTPPFVPPAPPSGRRRPSRQIDAITWEAWMEERYRAIAARAYEVAMGAEPGEERG